jgi:hypothetical protein
MRTIGEEAVMTTMTHDRLTANSAPKGAASWMVAREFWGSVTIVAMWLAVLFDGVFGGDMIFTNSTAQVTTIPSAVLVALFAAIATAAVAKRCFGRKEP